MNIFTEKRARAIFIGTLLIGLSLCCAFMAFISSESQPMTAYRAAVNETGVEPQTKVQIDLALLKEAQPIEMTQIVSQRSLNLDPLSEEMIEMMEEPLREETLAIAQVLEEDKIAAALDQSEQTMIEGEKQAALELAMNAAHRRVEDSIPHLVITEKVVEASGEAVEVTEPQEVEEKVKEKVEEKIEKQEPVAEEVSLQEGLMWIDRKELKFIVTLGNEHGVTVGDHMSVFENGEEIGVVEVDETLDVVSYVSPKDEMTRVLTQDYYQVQFK